MILKKIEPVLVPNIPEKLNEGILYISLKYKIAAHLCACGCGEKVFTPLDPSEWSITYDGESVSLNPSIGNFSFKCKSHYCIWKNKLIWIAGQSKKDKHRRFINLA